MSLWLPLALFVSTDGREGKEDLWRISFHLFVTVACSTLASILANDLADRHDDLAAGKRRWISQLPAGGGVALVTMLYGLGVLSLMLAGGGTSALGAYLAGAALSLSYSARPLQLKARGFLGPLSYGFGGMFTFVVLPWLWLSSNWRAVAVLAPAVLIDKWVNLHFHQIVDYEADRSTRTRTCAVRAGLERARARLKCAAGLSSLSLLSVLAFLALEQPVWGVSTTVACLVVVLAVAFYIEFSRKRQDRVSPLMRELPWLYLSLTHAVFRILPIMLLAGCALREPEMWTIVCVVGSLVLLESWHLVRYS